MKFAKNNGGNTLVRKVVYVHVSVYHKHCNKSSLIHVRLVLFDNISVKSSMALFAIYELHFFLPALYFSLAFTMRLFMLSTWCTLPLRNFSSFTTPSQTRASNSQTILFPHYSSQHSLTLFLPILLFALTHLLLLTFCYSSYPSPCPLNIFIVSITICGIICCLFKIDYA